jgi:hypothetical protein
LVVCPMETIKVKLINDQMKPDPQYKGLVHGIRSIVAAEGTHTVAQAHSETGREAMPSPTNSGVPTQAQAHTDA